MAVGKSSLVLRFVKGQFDEFQETTIGGMWILLKIVKLTDIGNVMFTCKCNVSVVSEYTVLPGSLWTTQT